ncbi:MAG: XdhC family protein [Proteobacteria bacterium]|nr:XdhC family protein [Pseudomonadota bacterium]
MRRKLLETLLADGRAKRSMVLATVLASGEQTLIYPWDKRGEQDDLPPGLLEAARTASRNDRSTTVETTRGEVFLRVFNPPLRLIVVGAVHIAQSLCPIAAMLGFDVTVVDPRTAFASVERFPGVNLVTEWPDQALDFLALDRRTAVVTLTHDPKLDEPALVRALASEVFYIGALGSKRTQASRLSRLREQGFDDRALARIRGPIGLDIAAQSTAEIAVSITAELVQTLRRRTPSGQSLPDPASMQATGSGRDA